MERVHGRLKRLTMWPGRDTHWLESHSLPQGHSSSDLETSHCGQVSGLTSQSVLPPNSMSWGRSFCHIDVGGSLCFKQWYLAMVETRIQICSSNSSLQATSWHCTSDGGHGEQRKGEWLIPWDCCVTKEEILESKGHLFHIFSSSGTHTVRLRTVHSCGRGLGDSWEQAKACPHWPNPYPQGLWQCSLMVFFTISLTL